MFLAKKLVVLNVNFVRIPKCHCKIELKRGEENLVFSLDYLGATGESSPKLHDLLLTIDLRHTARRTDMLVV